MLWFRNWKIRTKILSLVILMVLFISSVGFVGYYYNAKANSQMNYSYSNNLMSVKNLDEARVNSRAAEADAYNFFLSSDKATQLALQEDMKTRSEAYDASYDAYSKLDLASYEKERMPKLEQELSAYRLDRQKALAMKIAGDQAGAYVYYINSAYPHLNAFSVTLKELADYNVKQADEAHSQNAVDYTISVKLIIIISTIASLLGLMLGFAVASLISDSIKKVLVSVERVAAGDLSIEDVQIKGNDEAGLLATSFNMMKNNLHGLEMKISARTFLLEEMNAEFEDANSKLEVEILEHQRTELKLQETKRVAEAANKAKSQFLANMSHEIRTPMNGVFGFLELLNHSQLSQEQQEYVREAKSSSETLLHLINDILDLSKIESGKLTLEKMNFKLRNVVEDTMALFVPAAYLKHLELHTLIKANVPDEVRGDPSRLRQILNNLISNALKFTKNGEVSIVAETIEEVNGFATIKFEVKDTGIGINEEDAEKIFKPFAQADASTTRKFGGTGLGLAITRELVTMMEGTVGFESVPGQSSTFYFTARFEIVNKKTICYEYASLENVNVLIVDDNDNNRKIVRSYLEDVGCKVIEAESGDKAIATILNNAYMENKIQLVLADYQMPVMDGYELATTLNTIPSTKDLKLILLTSAAQEGDATKAREQGFSGYLTKPIRRDNLLNCMAIVLGLKPDTEESQQVVTKYTNCDNQSVLKPKILLVEDNEVNRKVIIAMLQSHDMACELAIDGNEAYQAVLSKHFDLVFMDCQMPVMDGFEATKKIREAEGSNKHTKIIAMTANAMSGDREKCLRVGMDEYISKPIDFEIMFKMIEETTVHEAIQRKSDFTTFHKMAVKSRNYKTEKPNVYRN